MDNASEVTMFTLSGFNGIVNNRFTLFTLTFVCYCVIVQVNVTIIVMIIMDKHLHQPMYIFLCNLCFNGLYGTAGFYPRFLIDILSASHVISYSGCLMQSFVLYSSACADFSLLVLMAYDRYVAICRPLVYHSVMTTQRVSVLVFAAWILPLGQFMITTIAASTVRLCDSQISKIYCVIYVIRRLECSGSIATVFFPAFVVTFYVFHVLLVIYSYFYIMKTCLASKESMRKFMKTCLPHLLSLVIMFVCLLFDVLHMRFDTGTLPESAQNFLAIQFLLFPPLLNPLIYGFKLTPIRNRIHIFLCRKS